MRVLVVALIIAGTTLAAQSEPAFDVVSIKPNRSLAEAAGEDRFRAGAIA